MASHGTTMSWEDLPDEILLHIIRYLEPENIAMLRLVQRRLSKFCLDERIWKYHCFKDSAWYKSLLTRRALLEPSHDLDRGINCSGRPDTVGDVDGTLSATENIDDSAIYSTSQARERRDMANWDPTFPGDRISWYDEYIQRNGPACVNWFQTPRIRDSGMETFVEARGMATYNPYNGNSGGATMLAVAPLDDGSVCLWDVKGTFAKQGAIIARSEPGILFIDGPAGQNTRRSKRIDTGVTECVSVNNNDHKAFFAVQSHLIEVDLNHLQVSSRQSFEWSITTLSHIHDGVPLTVGTSRGIHLHDFRARAMVKHEAIDQVDGPQWEDNSLMKALFDPRPLPPYASLSQPTPTSILHLPQPRSHSMVSDDIYVSGRFSSILHYDRRKFPAIVGSIYSGATNLSLAALPFPFSTVDNEVRRYGELSIEQADRTKIQGEGRTLIAGGDYKSKGSLEIYGLGTTGDKMGNATLQNSTLKNRHKAASAVVLSVTNHGSKIVFSDGAGLLKWFERDGVTECRRLRIGHSDAHQPSSLFASMPASDDLARKIVSTKTGWHDDDRANSDNVLFWTGEKLGLVNFTTAAPFMVGDFEPDSASTSEQQESQMYSERMWSSLKQQADEARFMRGLGFGPSAS
ncbi:hypothetical protein S7711_08675 [Stachybotrys chartarum IBT 7711]|uniref:F-box domain-containing protein n=1 Tax=Stachybotrys chartarum (strain CBS 109288 / IBT 7711) TaxID=1280523 RepID=A0A084AYV1_STACB|nr:hypothetical protein S7711_08675 [Stachybotrys chartarum IBT 7711]